MNRFSRIIVAAGVLSAVGSAGFSQAPGPGAFSDFREKHKYTFQLTRMARHIEEIDKDKKYTLTADQAKKVLAVLQPLRSKPKLTQDQAKQALKDLKRIFTVNQLNAMARIKPRRPGGPGPGGGGPPGAGGPGGQLGARPGGDRGTRPHFDLDAMKDFNPFYAKPPAGDKFAAERVKRWNEFFTNLQKKAAGAKKPAAKPAPKKK